MNILGLFKKQKNNEDNPLMRALYNLLRKSNIIPYDDSPTTYIEKGYLFNPHVYTVVYRICSTISQVKWKVYKVVDNKGFRRYKDTGDIVMRAKALELVDDSHDLQQLISQPNENQGISEFIFENVGYKMITGNSYTYLLKPVGMNIPTKLYNIPAHIVELVSGGWMQPVRGVKLRVGLTEQVELPYEEIIHRKFFNPTVTSSGKSPYGMSPLRAMMLPMMRSNEAYKASLAMLKNGIPPGIISPEGGHILLPEEVKDLEKRFLKKFGGGENKNKVLFASAQLSWQATGMSSVDMQLLDAINADLRDIARAYNVPMAVLSDTDTSTYNNVKEAKKSFWQDVLVPELKDIRDNLNATIGRVYSEADGVKYYIDYDVSDVAELHEDMEKLSKRLLNEMEHGIWTPNEVREVLGIGRVDDERLDSYFVATKLKKLE